MNYFIKISLVFFLFTLVGCATKDDDGSFSCNDDRRNCIEGTYNGDYEIFDNQSFTSYTGQLIISKNDTEYIEIIADSMSYILAPTQNLWFYRYLESDLSGDYNFSANFDVAEGSVDVNLSRDIGSSSFNLSFIGTK